MRRRGLSRRNRQQLQEVWASLVALVRAIVVNGLMVMLAPVLAPLSLAIQLWNALPSLRQVKRSIPRSFGEAKRVPYQVWRSVPSFGQVIDMLLRLVQTLLRDCMTRHAQEISQSTRQPVF